MGWSTEGTRRRSIMARMGLALAAGAMGLALAPWGAGAQIPESFENLQVLPEDLPRDSLIEIMRGFSFALGVRCQYCHVGGNGVSFEDVVFESDDDPDKVKARRMLEMVRDLNDVVLPSLPERDSPPVEVGCKTCHRAQARPVLLEDELRAALDEFGPDSASARYRSYRENPRVLLAGAFNFSEWEVNVLAERLGREGRTSDAIAIYELNAEYYPESVSIHLSLGALHVTANDTTAAIRSYERALQLNPNSDQIRERLQTLRGG